MTVAEMTARMSARELTEWRLFCRIEAEELEERSRKAGVARGAEQQARQAIGRR